MATAFVNNAKKVTMKNVLIITDSFPPLNSAASMRIYKLVRHMALYGWRPYVLTRRVGTDESQYDEGLLVGLPPGITVMRIPDIDLIRVITRLKRVVFFLKYDGSFFSSAPKSILLKTVDIIVARPLLCCLRFLERFCTVSPPDAKILWIPSLFFRGSDIIDRCGIDTILTNGNPQANSIHLVGYLIKKKKNVSWIVGYDDEWSQHPWRKSVFAWQARLDKSLEKIVLLSADTVLATTSAYRTLYAKLLPDEHTGKFHTLTDSFEDTDFVVPGRKRERQYMHIAYVGSLYGGQTPIFFLTALRGLLGKKEVCADHIKVSFFGNVQKSLVSFFSAGMPAGVVHYYGICTHEEAIKIMQESDLLLLIVSTARGQGNLPAKTYEYIRSGTRILALVPENGDAAVLIRDFGGIVVPPEDIGRIQAAIHQLYAQWQKGELNLALRYGQTAKYEAKNVTERLCHLMDECLKRRMIPVSQ